MTASKQIPGCSQLLPLSFQQRKSNTDSVCSVDRDPKRPLAFQAVDLIEKAQDAGATRVVLLKEQKALRESSTPHTLPWLFHSVIVSELENPNYLTSIGPLLQYL